CTPSTYAPYLSGSTIDSHGLTAPSANSATPNCQNSSSRSATPIWGSGRGVANESTAQYTPVVGSNRPRVVGESYTGGRMATMVRSPMSNDSPSLTHRQRSSGKLKQFV